MSKIAKKLLEHSNETVLELRLTFKKNVSDDTKKQILSHVHYKENNKIYTLFVPYYSQKEIAHNFMVINRESIKTFQIISN